MYDREENMKLRTLILVAFVCAAGLAIAQDNGSTPVPSTATGASSMPEGLPEEFGFYIKTEHGWERLHQNRAGKTEIKRGGFTQWTGIGVGGLHSKLDYAGPNAQCQIVQAKPPFYVRTADPAHIQELVIVRFKQKKDKRQIETAEMAGERTGGGETRNKAEVYSVTIKRLAAEVFVVTPESDLAPGEYILSQSSYATEGYDFGIGSTAVATK